MDRYDCTRSSTGYRSASDLCRALAQLGPDKDLGKLLPNTPWLGLMILAIRSLRGLIDLIGLIQKSRTLIVT